ncbi:hypothetical protein GALL_504740 [mine drainage metagenome]|uniref:Uncharacterized protein n=1 Tax=mine drainage metagenome TaxID=410659 RepID=A0A1J5P8M5_9ZZZZ
MANTEAAGRAREPSIGDEGNLAAHALPGQRCRGRKHFAHARTATRSLIADDDDLALFVGLLLDRLEGILFAIEATGGTGKFQIRHTRDFHDRSLRRDISLQTDNATGDGDRLVGGPHYILVRIPFHALEVFGDRPACDCHAVAMQVAVIEQRLHQKRYATSLKHIFGDITTARLQIRDIRCLFEDFGDVKKVELDTAFVSNRRQMQCSIGRAAGRCHHSGRIFQGAARHDVTRPKVKGNQIHDLFAGGHAERVANFIRRRRTGRIGQCQPDGFGHCRHGVGGELCAARAS